MLKSRKHHDLHPKVRTALSTHIGSDEEVLFSYKGVWHSHIPQSQEGKKDAKPLFGSPWLVITSENVFIAGLGVWSADIRGLPIKEVRSVDTEFSPVIDKIKITAPGINMAMDMWAADRDITSRIPVLLNKRKRELNSAYAPKD